MNLLTASEWDDFLSAYPNAHLLQTSAWGQFKSDFGWEAARLAVDPNGTGAVGAQVLFRRLPLGLSLAYLPKGPVGGQSGVEPPEAWSALWPSLDAMCRERKCVFLKVETDRWSLKPEMEGGQEVGNEPPPGFQESPHSIQPRRTIVVDLRGDEDRVLGRMKQKTRYNIRLALKRGVVVRSSSDLEAFYNLMEITGGRDAFGVHSAEYYRRSYEVFHPRGACELLIAEYEGQPLAGVMVFAHGGRAWYFYGASSNQHRELMPTYILQWEAMRWARGRGCVEYDLWGIPDEDEEILEERFTQRSDGLWGVYRFKRGFGGEVRRSPAAWDRVYRPLLYRLYRWRMGPGEGD